MAAPCIFPPRDHHEERKSSHTYDAPPILWLVQWRELAEWNPFFPMEQKFHHNQHRVLAKNLLPPPMLYID